MHCFSIHDVTKIVKERQQFDGFSTIIFNITIEDGRDIEVKLFTNEKNGILQIEDGEFFDCRP